MTTAAAVQFSDEYKFDVCTDAYLKFAEQYGRLITEKENIWTRLSTGARERYPLSNGLLAAAIMLFLADVAMRRFQYVPKRPPFLAGVRRNKAQELPEKMPENMTELSADAGSASEQPTGRMPPKAELHKKMRNQKKQKKRRTQPEETLDTSQLLKKRDERNL